MSAFPDLTFSILGWNALSESIASDLAMQVTSKFNTLAEDGVHSVCSYAYYEQVTFTVSRMSDKTFSRDESCFEFAKKSVALFGNNPSSELLLAYLLIMDHRHPNLRLSATVCTSDLAFCERAFLLAMAIDDGIERPVWMDEDNASASISVPDAWDFRS